MKNDCKAKALMTSAHNSAFTVAGRLDDQMVSQYRAVIHQSLYTGASLHTTKTQLQTLFARSEKALRGYA